MQRNKIGNKLIKFWVGDKLPDNHIFLVNKNSNLSGFIRKWLVHPIKRRTAKYYLVLLRRIFGLKVIAVTGSSGKTTVKEMLTSIFGLVGPTVSSYKNIDPVYNIPTTILSCSPVTKYLILEMGVEFPGEMDYYLWLAKPDIGVITNIYPTHTEYFGDQLGVFQEKKKLVEALDGSGTAVLNGENRYLIKLKGKLKANISYFGNGTEVMSSREKIIKNKGSKFLLIFDRDKGKRVRITIPNIGAHFISDALAASATAKALGISMKVIKKGLESYKPAEHRMNRILLKNGAEIFDDSYNNNPSAAIESIRTFREISNSKRKVIVFGDMLELGGLEKSYHEKIGRELAKSGLVKLICVGKAVEKSVESASKIMGAYNIDLVSDVYGVYPLLKPYLTKDVSILIKGSRSINLDRLVDQLSATSR